MAIPNYQSEVAAAAKRYPDAWKNAHTGNANTEDFIRLLAADLFKIDPRCGLNGKRGNPNDISQDVIAIRGEGTAVDIVNGGAMEIIDVIGGAGGPNPQAQWAVGPGGVGDKGTWIKPAASTNTDASGKPGTSTKPGQAPSPVTPPAPVVKPYPGDATFTAVGEQLFADFAEAGLTPKADIAVWFGRTVWDAVNGDGSGKVLTLDESIKKHRQEWRAALGLKP